MRTYELVLVLRPSLAEPQRKKLLETVKSWMKDAKVTKETEWGQKPLAYPIKKEVSGYYVDMMIESSAPSVGAGEGGIPMDFEKRITGNDDIIRHLVGRTK